MWFSTFSMTPKLPNETTKTLEANSIHRLVATQYLSVINAMFTQEKLQKDTYSFNGVKVLLVTTSPMYAQMQTVASSEW